MITDVPAVHLYMDNISFTILPIFDNTGNRHFKVASELRDFCIAAPFISTSKTPWFNWPEIILPSSLLRTSYWNGSMLLEIILTMPTMTTLSYDFWTSEKAYIICKIITTGEYFFLPVPDFQCTIRNIEYWCDSSMCLHIDIWENDSKLLCFVHIKVQDPFVWIVGCITKDVS